GGGAGGGGAARLSWSRPLVEAAATACCRRYLKALRVGRRVEHAPRCRGREDADGVVVVRDRDARPLRTSDLWVGGSVCRVAAVDDDVERVRRGLARGGLAVRTD